MLVTLENDQVFSAEQKTVRCTCEVYSEPNQTFMIENFAEIVDGWKPLFISAQRSVLDILVGSE